MGSFVFLLYFFFFFFFFNDTATTEIYTLSLHDALPISYPTDNGLTEIFALRGSARFALGGGQGFQLQNLRVNGFDVLGVPVATLQQLTGWQAPTADLAKPYTGQRIDVDELNSRGYIEVLFRDFNIDPATGGPVALDVASITDNSAEFFVVGSAARGVVVNGAAVQDANNPNLFRYYFTGAFQKSISGVTSPDPRDPYNTVEIQWQPATFRNVRGAGNLAESESFDVYVPAATLVAAAAGTAPPTLPVAQLASPFNGAVVTIQ